MIALKDLQQQLDLEVLVETTKTEIDVSVTDVNRPGMQLVGFYEYFASALTSMTKREQP